jgi:hypothetical protein
MAVRVFKASVTLLTFEQEAVATSRPALVGAARDSCRSFLMVRRSLPEGGSSARFFG